MRSTIVLAMILTGAGCEARDIHANKKARFTKNRILSQTFQARCGMADGDPSATNLEAAVEREFWAVCDRAISVKVLLAQCVPGNRHWVFCDGSVEALPPSESPY